MRAAAPAAAETVLFFFLSFHPSSFCCASFVCSFRTFGRHTDAAPTQWSRASGKEKFLHHDNFHHGNHAPNGEHDTADNDAADGGDDANTDEDDNDDHDDGDSDAQLRN